MPYLRSSSGTSSSGVQSTVDEGSIARQYWDLNLKRKGWKLVPGKEDDWCFIPIQYGIENWSGLKKAGAEKGEHYAEGDHSLYFMLQKYGIFDANETNKHDQPLLIDYKGPDLPTPRIQVTRAHRVSLSPPPSRSTAMNSFVNLCSPEEQKIASVHFEDLEKMKIKPYQGSQDIKKTLTSSLTEEVWGHGGNNPIPYRHLEAVLANDKNYIFVGSVNDEICSLFVYEFTGLKKRDATIRVYWTKHEHRKKGFVTKLMHEGLCFLVDDAVLHSGSTSSHGTLVFKSQGFHEYSTGNFCSVISSLRKHIESSITKKVAGDKNVDFNFGFKLSDDIIAIYEEKKNKVQSPKSSKDRKRSHEGSEEEPQDAKEKRLKTSTDRKISHDTSEVGSKDGKGEIKQRLKKLECKLKTLREEEESKLKTLQEEENVLESKLKKENDKDIKEFLLENFKMRRDYLYTDLKSLQRGIKRYEDSLLDNITLES
jgi:hypothetical protein